MIRTALLSLFCATALAAAGGCGGDDDGADQGSGRDAAEAYVEAQNARDATKICELYSDQVEAEIGATQNCPAYVQEQSSGAETSFELVAVDESGDRATATIRATTPEEGSDRELTIELRRQGERWQITSLG